MNGVVEIMQHSKARYNRHNKYCRAILKGIFMRYFGIFSTESNKHLKQLASTIIDLYQKKKILPKVW